MTARRWVPDTGDLIIVDFDPQAGHEQAGRHPPVVISSASYNASAQLALVCPVTNQAKDYPFEVALPSGLKITGVVLSDHIKSIDWKARRAKPADKAPRAVMDTVRQYLALLIGLPK